MLVSGSVCLQRIRPWYIGRPSIGDEKWSCPLLTSNRGTVYCWIFCIGWYEEYLCFFIETVRFSILHHIIYAAIIMTTIMFIYHPLKYNLKHCFEMIIRWMCSNGFRWHITRSVPPKTVFFSIFLSQTLNGIGLFTLQEPNISQIE